MVVSSIFNGNVKGTFANIAIGSMNPANQNLTRINLIWEDVNIGDTHGKGQLVLTVDPTMNKIKRQICWRFGGTEWTRKC